VGQQGELLALFDALVRHAWDDAWIGGGIPRGEVVEGDGERCGSRLRHCSQVRV